MLFIIACGVIHKLEICHKLLNISRLCKMKRSSIFCFIGCYKTLFYGFKGNNFYFLKKIFKYELHSESLIMKWL